VYGLSKNDWLIFGMTYVYWGIYYASHEGVTLTHEE
jgi:hypothetical protein